MRSARLLLLITVVNIISVYGAVVMLLAAGYTLWGMTTPDLTAHAATHTGRVRPANEDSYHCGRGLFVVADGLGGHAAGEVASARAVAVLAGCDPAAQPATDDAQGALAAAVEECNRTVHAEAVGPQAGMATTLTAAAVHGRDLLLAHVGDSRAYLYRGGRLRQLTTDHTAAREAVESGTLSEGEAARHPARHALTRAIGLDGHVTVDVPPPLPLEPGDEILLCSDGLTEVLDEAAIAGVLAAHSDVGATVDALVQATLEGGAPDNVTVVLVRVAA